MSNRRILARSFGEVIPSVIPISDIIAYYPVDTDSDDYFGNYNGTDTNMAYVTGGVVDDRADFTAGVSSQINYGDGSQFSFGDNSTDVPFSYSFWVNLVATTNTEFISKRISAGSLEYHINWTTTAGGTLQIQLFSQGNNTAKLKATIPFAITAGTWYHIVSTYDGAGGLPKLYRDGSLVTATNGNVGSYVAMADTTAPLMIGRHTGGGLNLNGYMDEIVISSAELTAGQITDLYDAGIAGNPVVG